MNELFGDSGDEELSVASPVKSAGPRRSERQRKPNPILHCCLFSPFLIFSFFVRFVSRRGPCRELYSDNATHFVGAKKEFIKMLKDERLNRSLVSDGTSWQMIPAGFPHQGGL